jgi:hypothetical protein
MPLLVTRSGATVSLAETQSQTQQALLAIPRANPELNFTGKTPWTWPRDRDGQRFVAMAFRVHRGWAAARIEEASMAHTCITTSI